MPKERLSIGVRSARNDKAAGVDSSLSLTSTTPLLGSDRRERETEGKEGRWGGFEPSSNRLPPQPKATNETVLRPKITNETVPLRVRLAFSSGHMLNVMGAAGVWYPYAVAYFTKVLRLSSGSVGTIMLVGQVVGALATPLVGSWSDSATGCRYGRRKIFHLLGVIAFVCSYSFVWHECFSCANVEESYQVLYFSSFAAVFQFGWTAIQVATLSLIPELTRVKSKQVELNSIRYGFQVVGMLFIFVCFWILLDLINNNDVDSNDLTPKDKTIFWAMAWVVIILGLLFSIPFQIVVKEKLDADTDPMLPWYKWMLKPFFYMVISAFIASKIITLFMQAYLPFYLLDTLEMDRASIAKGPLIFFIGSFIFTLCVKRMRRFIGDKMTCFLGLALVWSALIWLWVKQPTSDHSSNFNFGRDVVYVPIFLLGGGGATLLVISYSFVGYLVQGYLGSSAFVYACAIFGDRLSNGILLKATTQIAGEFSDSQLPAVYRGILVYVGFGASALGLLSLVAMLVRQVMAKLLKQDGGTCSSSSASIQLSFSASIT